MAREITRRAWQRPRLSHPGWARIPQIVIGVALATIVAGITIHAVNGGLGAGTPPFISRWLPSLDPLAAVSVVVVVTAVALAPRAVSRIRAPLVFAAFAFGLSLALGLAVNLARDGVHGWYIVFDTSAHGSFEAANEYLPSLPALAADGPRFFLDHFAELVPSLAVNASGHPPGLLLTMDALGLNTAQRLAAFCIGVGALAAPLAYVLGRGLLDERGGRVAALLTAFAPSVILDATVSPDAVYMTLGVACAALLVSRRRSLWLTGAVAVAIAGFFSWLLLGIPLWAAVIVGLRDGRRRAAWLLVSCAIAVLLFNGALALAVGYDAIGTLRATSAVYHRSLALSRPYLYWLFGSPTAWGVMLGIPTAVLALRGLAARHPTAIALAVIIVVSAVLGVTKAETERIWLPYVPLAAVAAAAMAPRRLYPLLGALALQALIVEVLFDTIW